MNGVVDQFGRSLLRIRVIHPTTLVETEIDAWIDTAFTGELMIPLQQVIAMGLPVGFRVRATLADGTQVDLDTYDCGLDWFGQTKHAEVIAGSGQFPLLGVLLLLGRELNINYRSMTLTLI